RGNPFPNSPTKRPYSWETEPRLLRGFFDDPSTALRRFSQCASTSHRRTVEQQWENTRRNPGAGCQLVPLRLPAVWARHGRTVEASMKRELSTLPQLSTLKNLP